MRRNIALIIAILVLLGSALFIGHLDAKQNIIADEDTIPEGALLEEFLFQAEPENTVTIGAVKIPIFIYHSVKPYEQGESASQDRYDITPELFRKQLAYLAINDYTPVTMDDVAHYIATGTTSPVQKPVVLGFDDGWHNQYTYAFPLLKKYHFIATFYIYTNPIGKKHFLSWDQVKEMSDAGMPIESHSVSHPYFSKLTPAEMKAEVFESKRILEEKLGKPVNHFASPFGYTSPELEALVKEAGYITSRTTYKGVYHSADDIFKSRGYLVSDNFEDFVTILNR